MTSMLDKESPNIITKLGKLVIKTSGPFEIICVHVNGTVYFHYTIVSWCDGTNKH